MQELSDLKSCAMALALAAKDLDDVPTDTQVQSVINRGCEVFACVVRLVKAVWKE